MNELHGLAIFESKIEEEEMRSALGDLEGSGLEAIGLTTTEEVGLTIDQGNKSLTNEWVVIGYQDAGFVGRFDFRPMGPARSAGWTPWLRGHCLFNPHRVCDENRVMTLNRG